MKKIKAYSEYVSQIKILIIVFILTAVCSSIFLSLPYNIYEHMLDSKFGFDRSQISYAMNELGPQGRSIYILSGLILDTIFPILYVTFTLGVFSLLGYQSNFLFIFPILAGVCDILENVQTAFIMNASSINDLSDVQILLASSANQSKWIFCCISFIILVYGLGKKLFFKKY